MPQERTFSPIRESPLICSILPASGGDVVLDVGAGGGALTARLAGRRRSGRGDRARSAARRSTAPPLRPRERRGRRARRSGGAASQAALSGRRQHPVRDHDRSARPPARRAQSRSPDRSADPRVPGRSTVCPSPPGQRPDPVVVCSIRAAPPAADTRVELQSTVTRRCRRPARCGVRPSFPPLTSGPFCRSLRWRWPIAARRSGMRSRRSSPGASCTACSTI